MAFDEARRETVLFGGNGTQETWTWDGAAWSLVASTGPNGNGEHHMVWDSRRQRIVLVTRPSGSGIETWEWDGSTWTRAFPTARPSQRGGFSIAFDEARGVTVLFGGNFSIMLSETWEYDGATWTQRSSGGPRGRISSAMAFDAARGETVLFGGYYDEIGRSFNLGDTWVWNGQYWREHFGIPGPSAREQSLMAFDSARGRIVLFGGHNRQSQLFDETWEWDGSSWTMANPASSPMTVNGGDFVFDRRRGVAVLYGGSETWEYLNGIFQPAAHEVFGVGCVGSGGVPRLDAAAGQAPRLGTSFTVDLSSLGTGLLVTPFGTLGASRSTYLGLALPLDLGVLRAPGCQLLVSMDVVSPLMNVGGGATWTIPIPNVPALSGAALHQQALVVDPGANPLGLVVSNGLTATLGL